MPGESLIYQNRLIGDVYYRKEELDERIVNIYLEKV